MTVEIDEKELRKIMSLSEALNKRIKKLQSNVKRKKAETNSKSTMYEFGSANEIDSVKKDKKR